MTRGVSQSELHRMHRQLEWTFYSDTYEDWTALQEERKNHDSISGGNYIKSNGALFYRVLDVRLTDNQFVVDLDADTRVTGNKALQNMIWDMLVDVQQKTDSRVNLKVRWV